MKKHHMKIKFNIPFQLFAILFLSIYIVALVTSPTTAVFRAETELLQGYILATDPFAGYEDNDEANKTDETIDNELENESTDSMNKQSIDEPNYKSTNGTNKQSAEETNDSNKPLTEDAVEKSEKDENESPEKDTDAELDDTTGDAS
ncbi:hypothetical protein AQ616_16630 [Oceanobacillus sp. E9]|uniref:hypothetical protein n=1 Tax=Oceanobacillus sp. E9 TaxID=1742575 RepID=UPI00084E96BA|nr:hypothetical protein [Oceanobacillus sp. E9]OEH53326.1 hypothetical protein AQ616_16630 [Oceanobacillus sp. E9]